MESNEIEVKFYIKDPRAIKKRIYKIAELSSGKYFETNLRYENQNNNLIEKRNLLVRLRKSKKVTLTIKLFPKINNTEFKIRRELEVIVSDFETMNRILNILGYHQEQVYEKWREKWRLERTVLCLDTMPYGYFLEIEGQPNSIKTIANKLGLKWNRRIISSYLEIFEMIKKEKKLKFKHLEFKNFKNHNDFEKYILLFEKN